MEIIILEDQMEGRAEGEAKELPVIDSGKSGDSIRHRRFVNFTAVPKKVPGYCLVSMPAV